MAISIKNVAKLLATIVVSLNVLHAQELSEQPRHPGQVIKFEIKFEGADADKVKQVYIGLTLLGSVQPNQEGFKPNFNAGKWFTTTVPKVFQAEITIPEDVASGEYKLNIQGQAEAGNAQYASGESFKLTPIRIANPRTFTKPEISVHEQH